MCPIRAEISTHNNFGKCIYLLFVWLAVIGFRQNYFYILPNFGDFGAKMSFFHYIINQKKKGGGAMFYRQKTKNQRGVGLQHTKYIIANGKLRQSSTF